MIDVLRYLMMLTGLCVWLAFVAFLVVGSLAYARQMREQRAAEDADYDAQRTEGMGAPRVVPFRSETRDRIAAQIARGQAREIAAEWQRWDEDEARLRRSR